MSTKSAAEGSSLREQASALLCSSLREQASALLSEDRWVLQTSNSFRRIGTMRGDGNVLCATTQPYDGHPDLQGAPGVLDYIVAAQPRVVIGLLRDLSAAEEKLQKMQTAVEEFLANLGRICQFQAEQDPQAVHASFREALVVVQQLASLVKMEAP